MSSLPSRHRRRLTAAVAAFTALVLLTACNPIQKGLTRSGGLSGVTVTYDGPAGAWLEVSVAGASGFDVRFRALVWLNGVGERSCRDATTGAVEPCEFEQVLVASDWYPLAEGFRSTVSPHDGDAPIVEFECRQNGSLVSCPDAVRVTLRTVDDDGDLVGDLT
jgi:hypothetical protein